jgi:hypothetical protein
MAYRGIDNKTPFKADISMLTDEVGREILVVYVKATYQIVNPHTLAIAKEQAPIEQAGRYLGDPEKSSLEIAPESSFAKLGTDVVLIGNAVAPNNKSVDHLDVFLKVGPVAKIVRVFGDRFWHYYEDQGQEVWAMTECKPFTAMPLIYENAFGGMDDTPEEEKHHEIDERNPIGKGLIARHNSQEHQVPMPNLEDPKHLMRSPTDRPMPAGFGFIAPHWLPRRQYAGTYDETWQASRMPLLPEDFDRKFFNAAHPDLIAEGFLIGNETVKVINASPMGTIEFNQPVYKPAVDVLMKLTKRISLSTQLDTVIVNTNLNTFQQLWRAEMPISGRIDELEQIVVETTIIEAAEPEQSNAA